MDTTQFAVLLTFIAIIVVFALFLVYRRMRTKTPSTEASEEKT
jgi:hypothetical protein